MDDVWVDYVVLDSAGNLVAMGDTFEEALEMAKGEAQKSPNETFEVAKLMERVRAPVVVDTVG